MRIMRTYIFHSLPRVCVPFVRDREPDCCVLENACIFSVSGRMPAVCECNSIVLFVIRIHVCTVGRPVLLNHNCIQQLFFFYSKVSDNDTLLHQYLQHQLCNLKSENTLPLAPTYRFALISCPYQRTARRLSLSLIITLCWVMGGGGSEQRQHRRECSRRSHVCVCVRVCRRLLCACAKTHAAAGCPTHTHTHTSTARTRAHFRAHTHKSYGTGSAFVCNTINYNRTTYECNAIYSIRMHL